MTNEQLQQIDRLEVKLKEKLLLCESLSDECNLLRELLMQRTSEFLQLQQQYNELTQKYNNQRIAVGLNPTSEHNSDAKEHLESLVQEIDKCIQLLKT